MAIFFWRNMAGGLQGNLDYLSGINIYLQERKMKNQHLKNPFQCFINGNAFLNVILLSIQIDFVNR